MERAYEKFLRYAVINTKSDEASETMPSTMNQFDLAHVLVEELRTIGIEDAHVDENCYVMGTLKGNVENAPVIGLMLVWMSSAFGSFGFKNLLNLLSFESDLGRTSATEIGV
jgi:hypothetical protein